MRTSISTRLTKLESEAIRSRPAVFTILLKDGTKQKTDVSGAWQYFYNADLRKDFADIDVDLDSYAEIAGLIRVLCLSDEMIEAQKNNKIEQKEVIFSE